MSRLSAGIAVVAGMLLVAGAAHAEWTVTPFAGVTVPHQTLLIEESGSSLFKNAHHKLFGIALGMPVANRFGLDLAVAYGNGELELVGGVATQLASSVIIADLKGRLQLLGGDDASLGLIAGVGFTQFRNGLFDALNVQDEDTELSATIAGLVGLGVRARLSDRMWLTVDGVDRIHDHGIEVPGGLGTFEEEMQHDLTFTAGLTFPLR